MRSAHETRYDRDPNEPEQSTVSEERLRTFPPSVKLVTKVLEFEGPMTQKSLSEETRLPQRTVRQATNRLEEEGIVERGVYIPDARQSLYSLFVALP